MVNKKETSGVWKVLDTKVPEVEKLKFLHGRFEMWVWPCFWKALGSLLRKVWEGFKVLSGRFHDMCWRSVSKVPNEGCGCRDWQHGMPPRSWGYHLRFDSNTRLLAWLWLTGRSNRYIDSIKKYAQRNKKPCKKRV